MTELKYTTKTVCNPFRYLDLYELKKILRDSGSDMDNQTKTLIQSAIKEKLDEERENYNSSYLEAKDFLAV